jgi:hypothetical protein
MNVFGGKCVHTDNGIQCSKNSIDDLKELHLMHPNNDGNAHRDLISNGQRGYPFYQALKKRNWNTDGFVVEVRCKSHHHSFDTKGKCGKLSSRYKKGKHNNPDWLKEKYETMALQDIADLCEVSNRTILNRMIKFGHPRRKSWQRP